MTKFELGKRVICTKDVQFFTKGNEYKIQNIGVNHITLLDDDGENHDWFVKDAEETFEIIPTENQRITALENEVSELKLIVHQLRKPNVVKHVPVLDGSPLPSTVNEEVSTSSVEDTIEYEAQQYQKVDRVAREGDFVSVSFKNGDCFKPDKFYGPVFKRGKDLAVKADSSTSGKGFEVANVYNDWYGRTPETVDVYELIKPSTNYDRPPTIDELMEEGRKVQDVQHQTIPCSAANTNNQLRAEIIEKAKGFVEEHGAKGVDFVVNNKFQAVTSIYYDGKDVKKASALCHPNDVFNEHIGQAIALGRALGIDVSEFEGAVQPNRRVDGMVMEWRGRTRVIATPHVAGETCDFDSEFARYGTIINDTNAIYD